MTGSTGSGERRRPPDHQGIFVSIVVGNHPRDLESHPEIKRLCPLVGLSDLCRYLFFRSSVHRPLEQFSPDAFPPMLRMNGDGDNVSIRREDDISRNSAFLSVTRFVDIDQKGLRIKIVEVNEDGPVVWGFWKRLKFNPENAIEIGGSEGPNHWHYFIPEMMEAMPPVNGREITFFSPAFLMISS